MSILERNVHKNPCYRINANGVGYLEYSCVSNSEQYYTEFEKQYDPAHVLDWMIDYPALPILACVSYMLFCRFGVLWFENRQRWNWRTSMGLWNLSLSVFSFCGMFRTAPALLHNLQTYSLRDNLCLDPQSTYGSGSTGLWVQLFILSKFPELVDTFFIVIHKKPLIFLHWYHHVTVLLYCWHSYVTKSPPGIFFVVMNYSVHAVMYGYYFLMVARMRPKWIHPMMITVLQISQMIVGVAVTLLGFYYYKTDPSCQIEAENNTAAFLMYGSYLFLFMQFFLRRYFGIKTTAKKKTY